MWLTLTTGNSWNHRECKIYHPFILINLFICFLLLDMMRDPKIVKICSGSLNMLHLFDSEQCIEENALALPCYKLLSLITPEKSKLLKRH